MSMNIKRIIEIIEKNKRKADYEPEYFQYRKRVMFTKILYQQIKKFE